MQQLKIKPDAKTFGALMVCLSRSTDRAAAELADCLLREQRRLYKAGNQDCRPDAMHYNAVMHCWSSRGNAKRVLAMLTELVDEHINGNLRIDDDRPLCTALAALSRSRNRDAVDDAEATFQEFMKLCNEGIFEFQPSAKSYKALQGCWASAERPVSGEKCLSLLHEMQEKYTAGDETMRPTESTYAVAIDAFARISNPRRAEEVWYEMLQSFLDGNAAARPGPESCRAVLAACLIADEPNAVQKTLEVIDRIAEVDRSGTIGLKVDRNTYHILLDICSKATCPDKTAGAEAILHKMKEVHDEGRGACGPDARCYNIVINCWGKVKNAERSEALFWEMYSEHTHNGNQETKPDKFTISTVLSAWARSRSKNATRRADVFFERIMKLIDVGKLDNFQLDSACYAALLNCLANGRTAEAADRAESIFSDMKARHRSLGDRHAQLTEACYFSVIKCLTRVGRIQRAEQLLFEMYRLFIQGQDDLKPRKAICEMVLKAWLNSDADEAPLRAEKLLRWMNSHLEREEQPDALTYASLLRCWARSRRPDSGEQAEAILLEMARRFGSSRPLVKDCYSDLLCALARSGSVERAEELLLRMCEMNNGSTKQPRGFPVPQIRAFVAVLAALSRVMPTGANIRTLRIIDLLRDIDPQSEALRRWDVSADNPKPPDLRVTTFLVAMEELDNRIKAHKGPAIGYGRTGSHFNFALKF